MPDSQAVRESECRVCPAGVTKPPGQCAHFGEEVIHLWGMSRTVCGPGGETGGMHLKPCPVEEMRFPDLPSAIQEFEKRELQLLGREA
jgi:hypothetical protein